LTLRDSRVRFIACDMPVANDLTLGIIALMTEQQRQADWRRTREALTVVKARGAKPGNPDGATALRQAGKGGAPLREAVSRNAEAHSQDLAPVQEQVRAQGVTSLCGIAAALNERGMLTCRGGRWHVSNVRNLLAT
jgi:DNA invertase Pin-like site-specific DNA recombinase